METNDPRITTINAGLGIDDAPFVDPNPARSAFAAASQLVERRAPSRAEIIAFRQKEETEGIPFDLSSTMPGFEGRVKRLTLADRAQTGSLPSAMQDRVVAAINRNNQGGGSTSLSVSQYLRRLGNNEDMASPICLIGFLSPRLVETEEELAGLEDAMLLTDIDINDRLAYLNFVLGTDLTAGGRLKRTAWVPGQPLGGLGAHGGYGATGLSSPA